MARIKMTLRGSTLIEMVVMTIVAGVIFLSMMDGLMLFSQLQAQRVAQIMESMKESQGFSRVALLVYSVDSIQWNNSRIELYREGQMATLVCCDSSLIYYKVEFCDTLLRSIIDLKFTEVREAPDTLEVHLASGFIAKFSTQRLSNKTYYECIQQIEKKYGYER